MAKTTCILPDCNRLRVKNAWNYCHTHATRMRRFGDIHAHPRASTVERFWRSFDRDATSGCWVLKKPNPKGYGVVRTTSGRSMSAHRYAYSMLVEPVPDELQVDHLCRNRSCVNPSHLEPVTARENALRGESPFIKLHLAGTCVRNHPAHEFVYRQGRRACRACEREKAARYRAAKKAAAA